MSRDGGQAPGGRAPLSGAPGLWRLGSGVHLALCRFDEASLPGTDERLNAAGLGRAHPRRRAAFLAGRELARLCLGMTDLPRGPSGAPDWPPCMAGALSHGAGCVGIVAGPDTRRLGIDIEARLGAPNAEALRRRVLTGNEREWLEQRPEADVPYLLTLIFSAKECVYKALSGDEQAGIGFDSVEMAPVPHRQSGRWRIRPTRRLAPDLPQGAVLRGGFAWHENRVLTWLNLPRAALIPPRSPPGNAPSATG